MDHNLYAVLGVKQSATNDEIRRAYRKLAKDLHPDQNQGDAKAEEKFKRVSAAFAILGNPDKRKRYDAGEIDAMGNERVNPFYRGDYATGDGGYRSDGGFQPGGDYSDIFGDLFGRRAQAAAPVVRSRCAAWTTATISKSAFWRL